jgi:5-formyltetrahydrofolate cyclo-ligase
MYSKSEIRTIIKERKSSVPLNELKTKSYGICLKLEQLEHFKNSKIIVSYWPLIKEVDITELNKKYCIDKTILLPVIIENNITLKQFTFENEMEIGELGIKSPVGKEFMDFDKIDLIIVPGIAFDAKGNRLGRGKGYYDRFLHKLRSYKIGICFDFQLFEQIPVDNHDYKVDEVIFN